MNGWIGVDLDSTLAKYESGDITKYGITHIGDPIPAMVARVKKWLSDGIEVRIFTARAGHTNAAELADILVAIHDWCVQQFGCALQVTNEKDFHCIEIWDDRCVQVIPNTGERVGESRIADLPQEAETVK